MFENVSSLGREIKQGRLSGLAHDVKKIMVDMEGRVTRSEVYFTNIETGEKVQLCMTPEQIKARTSANFRSYNIVERGEVKLPKGEHLAQISWQGTLPGAQIVLYPGVTTKAYEAPIEIIKVFRRWREDGAKLKLLITQTPINLDVYLKSFDYEASGGMGDYKYSIDLVAAKDLQILTVAEADARQNQKEEIRANQIKTRARTKSKLGARISKINGLWAITKILTGKGSMGDWQQIQDAYDLDAPTDFKQGDVIIWG